MKLPSLSGWGWTFVIAALLPAIVGWKRFGLSGLLVPVVLIFLAHKAGAR